MSEAQKAKYEDLNFQVIREVEEDGIRMEVIDTSKWKGNLPKPFICGVCERVYGKS